MTTPPRPMPLASAVYHHPLKHRSWSRPVQVTFLAHFAPRAASRALRHLLPNFQRTDHLAAAAYHLQRARRLTRIWSQVAERAAFDAFGRPWEFHDYKICAIAREEFAPHHKRVLRHCAYNATTHDDLALAHTRAAGLRKPRGRLS